jgi:hypothetical protein
LGLCVLYHKLFLADFQVNLIWPVYREI